MKNSTCRYFELDTTRRDGYQMSPPGLPQGCPWVSVGLPEDASGFQWGYYCEISTCIDRPEHETRDCPPLAIYLHVKCIFKILTPLL